MISPDDAYVGIDISIDREKFKPSKNVKYVESSMFDLDSSFDESADVVLFCEVFEHLETPYSALHKIYSLLKPGGRLIMTYPNPLSLGIFVRYLGIKNVSDEKFLSTYLGSAGHKIFPMPPCMVNYLHSLGFKVTEVDFLKGRFAGWPILNKFAAYVAIVAEKGDSTMPTNA